MKKILTIIFILIATGSFGQSGCKLDTVSGMPRDSDRIVLWQCWNPHGTPTHYDRAWKLNALIEYLITQGFITSVDLPDTQVGFGNSSNQLSGSNDFIYDPVNKSFNVKYGSLQAIGIDATAGTYVFGDLANSYLENSSGAAQLTGSADVQLNIGNNVFGGTNSAALLGSNSNGIFSIFNDYQNDLYRFGKYTGNPSTSTYIEMSGDNYKLNKLGGSGTNVLTIDNAGILQLGGAIPVSPSQPATQVVYGTGSGLTSDSLFTRDPTNGSLRVVSGGIGEHAYLKINGTTDDSAVVIMVQNSATKNILSIGASAASGLNFGYSYLGTDISGIQIKAKAVANQYLHFWNNSIEWNWPIAEGSSGQALVTDGAGNLSFATFFSGGDTAHTSGTLATHYWADSLLGTISIAVHSDGTSVTGDGSIGSPLTSHSLIGSTSGITHIETTGGTTETWIGQLSGSGGASTVNTIMIGDGAGIAATNANTCVMIGGGAGSHSTNAENSQFIGEDAGTDAVNASSSIIIGTSAGAMDTSASHSVIIGFEAGSQAPKAANSIFIGYQAGFADVIDNTSSGTSICIGQAAHTNGFKNSIALGALAGNSKANQFLVAPDYNKWQIAGIDYIMPDSLPKDLNQVLTAVDTTGKQATLKWRSVSSGGSSWSLSGNAGTDPAINCIGAKDTTTNVIAGSVGSVDTLMSLGRSQFNHKLHLFGHTSILNNAGAGNLVAIDDTASTYQLAFRDTSGGSWYKYFITKPVVADFAGSWGDVSSVGNGTVLSFDDPNKTWSMLAGGLQFLIDGLAASTTLAGGLFNVVGNNTGAGSCIGTTFITDAGGLASAGLLEVNQTDSLAAPYTSFFSNGYCSFGLQSGKLGLKYIDGNQGAGKVLTSDASGNAKWMQPTTMPSASNYLSGQIADVNPIAVFTPVSDGSYSVGGNVNITSITAGTLNFQVSYTDESNTSVTKTFVAQGIANGNLTTTGDSNFSDMTIRVKGGTVITMLTIAPVTLVGVSYNVGAHIISLGY